MKKVSCQSQVLLFTGAATEVRQVKTDDNGTYKIDVLSTLRADSSNSLHFRSQGKEEKIIRLDKIKFGECNVMLIDSEETSSTGSRWNQSKDEIPASIVVVTRQEIEEQGYMTVQEILENVPGMFVTEDRSIV